MHTRPVVHLSGPKVAPSAEVDETANRGAGFGGSSKGPNKAARAGQFVSLRGESPSSFTGLLFGSGVAEIIATTSEANGAEEAVLAGEILTDLNLKKSIQDFTIG